MSTAGRANKAPAMAATTDITRERIAATEAVIRPYVRRTPLLKIGRAHV